MRKLSTVVVLTVPGALIASLLLAPAALANSTVSPAVNLVYLNTTTHQVMVGSSDSQTGAATVLSPAGIRAQVPEASSNGRVVAYGSSANTPGAGITWGLRVSVGGVSHLVTDMWDTYPSVDPSGAGVWWTSNTNLWRYDTTGGFTAEKCAKCVKTPAGTTDMGFLSVAPNGQKAAVEFDAYNAADVRTTAILQVLDIRPGATHRVLYSKTSNASTGTLGNLAFSLDSKTLVYAREAAAAIDGSEIFTLNTGVTPIPVETDTGLAGYSAQQTTVGGPWTFFQDDTTTDNLLTFTTTHLTPQTTTALTGFLHPDSATDGYAVVTTDPVVFGTPTPLPANAILAGPPVSTGKVSFVQGRYCILAACDSTGYYVGTVMRSFDDHTWVPLLHTTDAAYPATTITRNTFFRFVTIATPNLAAATSAITHTTYLPTYTAVKLARVKGKTAMLLTGRVTRPGGHLMLRVLVKNKWRNTAVRVGITSRGAFTYLYPFSTRQTYDLVTMPDAYAGASMSHAFKG